MGRRKLGFYSKNITNFYNIKNNGEGLDCGSKKSQAAKNLELKIKLNKIKNKSENQGPSSLKSKLRRIKVGPIRVASVAIQQVSGSSVYN